MRTETVATRFLQLSVLNGFLALIFTLPILDPMLCIATPPGTFGCKATMDVVWPGTWILVAYIVFLGAGVGGTLFWGANYYFASRVSNKTQSNGFLGMAHILIWEVGVLLACGMMAAIGFVGGSFLVAGGTPAVASAKIAEMLPHILSTDPLSPVYDTPVVVEALGIGVAILGGLIGFLNFLLLKSEPPSAT